MAQQKLHDFNVPSHRSNRHRRGKLVAIATSYLLCPPIFSAVRISAALQQNRDRSFVATGARTFQELKTLDNRNPTRPLRAAARDGQRQKTDRESETIADAVHFSAPNSIIRPHPVPHGQNADPKRLILLRAIPPTPQIRTRGS